MQKFCFICSHTETANGSCTNEKCLRYKLYDVKETTTASGNTANQSDTTNTAKVAETKETPKETPVTAETK